MIKKQWGVQLDDAGSMDFYDSEREARENARGCPIWSVTYELLSSHVCEECPTCGVHEGRHDKCCGCYDGVCCQESTEPTDPSSD